MPTKIEQAKSARIKMNGGKEDLNSNIEDTKSFLHEEYKKAIKKLEELKKIEKSDSKRLIKQMEIVANLSPYKEI